jgi:hypothetical protein
VYLTSLIQAPQQFIRLTDVDEFAPARGFHRGYGFRVGIEGLEWQGFFRRDAHQQQAKGIRDGKTYFLQGRSGFPLGAFINAGADNGILTHGVNLLLSYIVAQVPENTQLPNENLGDRPIYLFSCIERSKRLKSNRKYRAWPGFPRLNGLLRKKMQDEIRR